MGLLQLALWIPALIILPITLLCRSLCKSKKKPPFPEHRVWTPDPQPSACYTCKPRRPPIRLSPRNSCCPSQNYRQKSCSKFKGCKCLPTPAQFRSLKRPEDDRCSPCFSPSCKRLQYRCTKLGCKTFMPLQKRHFGAATVGRNERRYEI